MSEMEWLRCFSEKLQTILDDYRMTQKELAEEADLSEASISRYLNCERMPNIKSIVNIAYVLDCSVDELVDFDDMIY